MTPEEFIALAEVGFGVRLTAQQAQDVAEALKRLRPQPSPPPDPLAEWAASEPPPPPRETP